MKILSLNLCTFMLGRPRKERLQEVADFVKANEVDVILAQEGLRVCYPVYDSIRQLADELDYDYFARTPWGWPFFAESRVAVISRFHIHCTASLSCEVPQTEWADAIPIPWRKRAVAATVVVPGLGITTLVSVHLTSSPKTVADRAKQLKMVADWIDSLPARDVTIYGGDFNAIFEREPNDTMFGVSPDYIFAGGAAKITKGERVLTGHIVTDHGCGIVAEVEKV